MSCLIPAMVLQATGGVLMGALDLPFAMEAAAAVLGLQVLPALLIIGGYFVFECMRGNLTMSGNEQVKIRRELQEAMTGDVSYKTSALMISRLLKRRRAIVRRRR